MCFRVQRKWLYDKFFNTDHIETVALLGRKKDYSLTDIDLDVEKLVGKSRTVTYKEISEYVNE